MERTKKREIKVNSSAPEENQLLWLKIGGGSLRLKINGKDVIIKLGQKFYAKKEEISSGFLDTLECLSDDVPETTVVETKGAIVIKKNPSIFKIVLAENNKDNKTIQEQINDLEEMDFEDADDVETLKTGLIENGHNDLAALETEKLKDAVIKTLKSSYVYDIVNKKGKKVNSESVTFAEAEKLVEALS